MRCARLLGIGTHVLRRQKEEKRVTTKRIYKKINE